MHVFIFLWHLNGVWSNSVKAKEEEGEEEEEKKKKRKEKEKKKKEEEEKKMGLGMRSEILHKKGVFRWQNFQSKCMFWKNLDGNLFLKSLILLNKVSFSIKNSKRWGLWVAGF